MTDQIRIFDTTLRDGEQAPGCSMTMREKLRIAKALSDLRVDVIEAGFPAASPGDFEAVQAVAEQGLEPIICGLARCNPEDIEKVFAAVKDVIDEANAGLGEKIEVRRVARVTGDQVVSYLHKTNPDLPAQIGVLVATTGGDAQVARDIAMHVAAFSPTVLSREEIDAETVENERRIAEETAREEGKPEQALPKIIEGRVNGFFKENVLLDQSFAKDAKKSVGQVAQEAGAEVTGFARFKVGV